MAKYSYTPRREYGRHGIVYADSRRSNRKRLKWPFGILILLILSAGIFCAVCYFNDINPFSTQNNTVKKLIPHSSQVINRGSFFPDETSVMNKANPTISSTSVLAPSSVNQATTQQQAVDSNNQPSQQQSTHNLSERDIAIEERYENASFEFSKGNYAECRNILRLLVESVSPRDSSYRKITSLLTKASKNMYDSGNDPELSVLYTVVKGDTLSAIAKKFSTTVSAIQKNNGMTNTKLSIGKELKITKSAWSVEVRRASDELILFSNGKLFAFYRIYAGTSIPDSFSGEYRIVDKNPAPVWKVNGKTYPYGNPENICGARLIALNPVVKNSSSRSTAIHGTNTSGAPDTSPGAPGFFRMANDDIQDIYDLLPIGTRVHFIIY